MTLRSQVGALLAPWMYMVQGKLMCRGCNKVDFLDSRNMMVAAITLVLGTGDFTLSFGGFSLGGIGTATFGAILLNAVLNYGKK